MFEIGKVYKCRNGSYEYKIVAKTEDGTLICETVNDRIPMSYSRLSYRNADGTLPSGSSFRSYDLIDPDEPTPEELEWLAKLCEARDLFTAARSIRDGKLPTPSYLRQLKVIREMLNHART